MTWFIYLGEHAAVCAKNGMSGTPPALTPAKSHHPRCGRADVRCSAPQARRSGYTKSLPKLITIIIISQKLNYYYYWGEIIIILTIFEKIQLSYL